MASSSSTEMNPGPSGDARFRALTEYSSEAIALLDPRGCVLYASPSTQRILGHRPEKLTGSQVQELVHRGDLAQARASLENILRSPGAVVTMELRLRAGDGEWRWFEATARNLCDDPAIAAIVVNYRDISERRAVEEELLRGAAIVNSSNDAIFAKSLEGIILSWNPGAQRMYGYTAAEVVGMPVTILSPPDRRQELAGIMDRLRRGESIEQLETVRVRKDGTRFHVSLSISPLKDRAGHIRGITTTARDITDRKVREAQARKHTALARLLQAVAVAANEARTLDEGVLKCLDLICLYEDWAVGHALLRPPGAAGELVSTDFWHLGGGRAFEFFREATRGMRFGPGQGLPGRVLGSREPIWVADVTADSGFLRREAAAALGLKAALAFPVVAGDEVAGVLEFYGTEAMEPDEPLLAVARSIGVQLGRVVERARGEKALRESEEQYRVITETASDAIVSLGADGIVLFANRAAGRVFGYQPSELEGREIGLIMPDRLRGEWRDSLARYLESGDPEISGRAFEMSGVDRHGREVPLEVSFGESRKEGRRIVTAIIRDITERKRMQEQLRHTQKLESLGVLAGGVAHDFNNLLTGIMGNSSLALDMLPAGNPARAPIESAIAASQRAADLTHQMLAYAGKGRFVLAHVNLSDLVREIAVLIQASIPKTVHLRLDLDPRLPAVEADPSQLQQLVMNLIINGAEAIGEDRNGSVTVTTCLVHVDEAYITTALAGEDASPGPYVSIEVQDTGCGMDEETLTRIFDPFFTTKFTGRGLGLAAVSGIVRGHKGFIRVYSTPGRGSTFKVLLPAAGAEGEAGQAAETRELQGTGVVLVVDDEEIVRRTARGALERYGYTVLLAENGREAVELFRADPGRFSLVLLDMTMPVMGGEETLSELRAISPDIPVILSSGYNEVEAIRRFTGKRLAGFVQKPYTAGKLAGLVKSVIGPGA